MRVNQGHPLPAGEYITFPSLWWHSAYNLEFTVSVNNTFMTPYDVPQASTGLHQYRTCLRTGLHQYSLYIVFRLMQVLFNTVRLGIHRTRRDDIEKYNRPVILGSGLSQALSQAYDSIFGEEVDMVDLSDREVERRGAWMFTANHALLAYQQARSGTRGGGKGMQSELSIEGFSQEQVDIWMVRLRKLMGVTPNAAAHRSSKAVKRPRRQRR